MSNKRIARCSRLVAIAFFYLLLAVPAPADTAVPLGFLPCPDDPGFSCGNVVVPVDRSGAVPELAGRAISLNVMIKPAAVANTDGALFALAGGPGQAATPAASDFAEALASALQTRDLVVFDQRGTGSSGYLDCPGASSSSTLEDFVIACAQEIGPARDFYSSKDSAEDIEAIRQAIGVERVTIFGVSYGTYVAQLYSRLFPAQTAALVLDSVVPATGVDPFLRSNFQAISKVLKANCSRGLCRGITRNPLADLSKVVKLVARKPLRVVDGSGTPRLFKVGEADLLDFVVETFSLDAVARARTPAALRSARAGDTYPLGRLLLPAPSSSAPSTEMSVALYMATSCADTPFPWNSTDDPATRGTKASDALAALPANTFSPFSRSTVLALSNISICRYWPPTGVSSAVPAPVPDVAVLVLEGLADDLTPLADAVSVGSLFPHAIRVNVPFSGHSVISNVWPNADVCVSRALRGFFSNQPIPSCSFVKPFFRPTPVDPSSFAKVKPLRLAGERGRTLAAALGTLSDVTMSALSMVGPPSGLRSGFFSGPPNRVRLRDVVYVPGVQVNGTANLLNGVARVSVSGKASRGSLTVRRGKKTTLVTGKLGGRSFSVRVRTPANDAKVITYLPRLLERTAR